ncbi:N-acetylmuramoyl-L-alanine amidase [Kineococcus sp. SYSU DK006]|uniref:N-acetylmuramoyl-L-alanine amidase n=1 Tax=Kineococcus sp. SYSU DK006 TaxID=3383127 RepID=UPI003D7DB98E
MASTLPSPRPSPPDPHAQDPHAPRLSRRAALAGAGGALAVLAVPAPATAAAGAAGSTRSLALGGRALAAHAADAAHAGATRVVAVPVDGGSMLGVVFPRGTSASSVGVRVRRAGGQPGPWLELPLGDGAPDPDRDEPEPTASDPVWTGELGPGATVELRLPAADVGHARLEVVDPGAGPAAPPAPRGAAALQKRTALAGAAAGGASAAGGEVLAGAARVARPRIRSRAEWGADESLRRTDPDVGATIRAAIVHHTADGGSYSQAEVPSVIRGMHRYHTVSLGWNDLGYNVVVDRFGGIWEGRAGGVAQPVVGAHAGGFNTDTLGVSMMGDFTDDSPSEACLQAVAEVIAWKFALHGVEADGSVELTCAGGGTARYGAGETAVVRTISGHRDVGFTACPGDVGYTHLDDVRSRVAALLGAGGGTAAAGPAASAVEAKHAAVGGAALLGAPTSAEGDALHGGRFRHYERGSIYWHPATGAVLVRGTHAPKYASLGWERSALGFPTADTTDFPGGTGSATHFQGGSIYRRAGGRPHAVLGAIRATWASMGWETSALGYPTSDEHDVPGGRASDFEGGQLRWNRSTGAVRLVR